MAADSFSVPRDRKSIQRYMGTFSYRRRFLKDFAVIARKLTTVLRNDINFKIGAEELALFYQMKLCFNRSLIPKLFDQKTATEVHCDASMIGLVAIFRTRKRPRNCTLLSKLGTTNPKARYKHVRKVQQFISDSPLRITLLIN